MSIALVDCNNFYAACEQSIDPSIANRPVVVLSNNDGCVIARNAEAKSLGISMGQPYFKIRRQLEEVRAEVRSSNYTLYADMSQRFMDIMRANCEELEVYSIDEAFVKISRSSNSTLAGWARRLRETIYQRLSLPIAIGIGETKSQAKLANHLAKKMVNYSGLFDLGTAKDKDYFLKQVEVESVWGIGSKLAHWCHTHGIHNALQLRDMPSNKLKEKIGIKGIRLQYELKGHNCIDFLSKAIPKKETCVSNSVSKPISNIEGLRQLIATHTIRASEKLRKQNQNAASITIFTRTSFHTPIFYSRSATKHLEVPSNDTRILLAIALGLTKEIFHPNYLLIKAGVTMQGLLNADYLQLNLLSTARLGSSNKGDLIKAIDNLNKRYGQDTVYWAACGINQKQKVRRRHLSPLATTRLSDIPIVQA